MDAKIGFLLLGQDAQNLPSGRAVFEPRVCQRLTKDNMDDPLTSQELATPGVANKIGHGGRGGRAGLGIRALEVANNGEDGLLTQCRQLRV